MYKNFRGVFTALITPFLEDGSVDYESYVRLISSQIDKGISGLVPCGSTGEAPSLELAEQLELIGQCVKLSKGRVPVMAGVGSNNTAHTIHLAKEAESLGADALLIIVPYYNKPSKEGIIEHFRAIDKAVNIPIVVYNHPGRTGVDIGIDVIETLSGFKNIAGTKDLCGDFLRPLEIKKRIGDDFIQFSGDDGTNLALYSHGGHGAISVAANILPSEMENIYKEAARNNFAEALKLHAKYTDLYNALSYANPIAVKYFTKLLGISTGKLRLPLVELDQKRQDAARTILSDLSLI